MFKPACDAIRIHKEAVVRVLPFFVKNALATTSNTRMSTATNIAPAVASVQLAELLGQKQLIWSYLEAVNVLLMKFANNQAIADMDAAALHYTQPPSVPLMQYADDNYAKSCKAVDVHDESTLNNIFIESVDSSIFHSLQEYRATSPQADLTDASPRANN